MRRSALGAMRSLLKAPAAALVRTACTSTPFLPHFTPSFECLGLRPLPPSSSFQLSAINTPHPSLFHSLLTLVSLLTPRVVYDRGPVGRFITMTVPLTPGRSRVLAHFMPRFSADGSVPPLVRLLFKVPHWVRGAQVRLWLSRWGSMGWWQAEREGVPALHSGGWRRGRAVPWAAPRHCCAAHRTTLVPFVSICSLLLPGCV